MKSKVLIVLMSVSAITPAILGNAWALSDSQIPGSQLASEFKDCDNRGAKKVALKKVAQDGQSVAVTGEKAEAAL